MKKPKIACLTTVRTQSSRLPNKTLLQIRGKRVIDHVIDRMKNTKKPDLIILCTSDEPEDDILVTIAKKHGIKYFRGSAKDRLQRMLGAVEKFNLDYIATFDADDLFCDPELIDLAITQMLKDPCDVIKAPASLPCGSFAFCISANTLREACRIKDTDDTEMFDVYILDKDRFNVRDLVVKNPVFHNDRVRLTLDYQEDFNFFARVFDGLKMNKNIVPLSKILQYVKRKPELAMINFSRHKDYIQKREKMRLKKKIKKI